jgi:RNA polymerase sigma-54 factor
MNNLLIQLSTRQTQQLLLSTAMQQAFHVLQMPILELEEWLKNEIEQNPVLEYIEDDEDFTEENFETSSEHQELEPFIPKQHSLYEHLMNQATLTLSQEELAFAEQIIGNLDDRGFFCGTLPQSPEAHAILAKIQSFDPPGIAAFNVQDSLLLQLRFKEKTLSLAYQVIQHHFEDLIHNRIPVIQKKLECSLEDLQQAIHVDIATLSIHPAAPFNFEPTFPIAPDLRIEKDEEWKIEVYEDTLPAFRIAPLFLNLSETTSDLRKHITAGKWLERIVSRRKKLLKEIGSFLIKKQPLFLSGQSKILHPCSLQELAEELALNPSTVARAVSHKYLHSVQGLLPLRSFFSQASVSDRSSQELQEIVRELLEKEDKSAPLSDAALSKHLKRQGISVARRTIAKYRKNLKLLAASHRRRW